MIVKNFAEYLHFYYFFHKLNIETKDNWREILKAKLPVEANKKFSLSAVFTQIF